MIRNFLCSLSALIILMSSCQPVAEKDVSQQQSVTPYGNPAADGFNADASDSKAITIADSVMTALGGRKAWDNSRYFSWNFFGARSLWWDKKSGDVRIEIPKDSTVILVNINSMKGKAQVGGEEIVQPDTLARYLQRGKSIWINDAYWLFMPFKFKDSGVTLTYQGQDTTQSGTPSHVLQLVFEEVGDTPQNKYHVFVDTSTYLVRQWSFFSSHEDDEPAFTTPWDDYRTYGSLLLSGDRGERQISEIKVWKRYRMALLVAWTSFKYHGGLYPYFN